MGKGGKDRGVPLPEKLIPKLSMHLEEIKSLHQEDLKAGFGEALLPPALIRKLNGAQKEWAWQFVFPAQHLKQPVSNYCTGILKKTVKYKKH